MDPANLNMLIELARAAADAAAARHAQCRESCEAARRQLEVLRGYARDYDRRAQTTLSQGVDVAAQNNLRAFVAKLARAIELQSAEVARREQQAAAAAAELAQMNSRLMSLQKLAERRARQIRQKEARREQRTLDDLGRAGRDSRFGADSFALKW
jgi:flagellar export protein FliJ